MRLCCCAFVLVFLYGCGGEESFSRIDLVGTVNVGGQPVEAGKIQFTPIEGTSGPNTLALIQNGKFETAPSMGAAKGKYQVQITVLEKNPDAGPEDEDAYQTVGIYDDSVTISSDKSEFAFDIDSGDLSRE